MTLVVRTERISVRLDLSDIVSHISMITPCHRKSLIPGSWALWVPQQAEAALAHCGICHEKGDGRGKAQQKAAKERGSGGLANPRPPATKSMGGGRDHRLSTSRQLLPCQFATPPLISLQLATPHITLSPAAKLNWGPATWGNICADFLCFRSSSLREKAMSCHEMRGMESNNSAKLKHLNPFGWLWKKEMQRSKIVKINFF